MIMTSKIDCSMIHWKFDDAGAAGEEGGQRPHQLPSAGAGTDQGRDHPCLIIIIIIIIIMIIIIIIII